MGPHASAALEPALHLAANNEAVLDARAQLSASEPGLLTRDDVNKFIAFVKHLDRLEPPVSIEAFGPAGTEPIQEQEQFINDLVAGNQERRNWRAAIGAAFEIRYERDPEIVGMHVWANHEAVRAARARLQAGAPGLSANDVSHFIAFVKHLDRLEPPMSIEAFGPEGTEPIREQEQFINDLIAANPARGNWRAAIGATFEIRYESDPEVVGMRVSANYEAVRATRTRLQAGAPGLSMNSVSEFIAFVKHLDRLEPPMSIEAFGPEGTEPIQDQEQFINDLIAANPARGNWRAAISAAFEIRYERAPQIVGMRVSANHEAVRAARARLQAGAPGLSANYVSEFIAFVKHLDRQEPPVSIKSFGPEGTEPIREQEQFINDLIAANPARGNWRAAIGAVLEIRLRARAIESEGAGTLPQG